MNGRVDVDRFVDCMSQLSAGKVKEPDLPVPPVCGHLLAALAEGDIDQDCFVLEFSETEAVA